MNPDYYLVDDKPAYVRDGQRIYLETEIDSVWFRNNIIKASDLWALRCRDYVTLHGDSGSCVLGAGFSVLVRFKGQRKPREVMVLKPRSPSQGSLSWEASQEEIADLLKEGGIAGANYNWGRMD